MGLDIGVVQIKYLRRPDQPAYDFAWHLNINEDDADWNGSSSTFVEYTRETLLEQLDRYVSENRLAQSDKERLRCWVDGLPWKDDVIMLHLAW